MMLRSMRTHTLAVAAAALGLLLLVGSSLAAIPNTITFQGYLTDAGGVPLSGPQQLVFSIYDGAPDPVQLWTSNTVSATVVNGVVTVELGDTLSGQPAIGVGVFSGYPRYLGVKVGADAEMMPRQKITSVGFALKAGDSDTLGGMSSGSFSLSTHNHDAAYVSLTGAYANPAWLTSIASSKVNGNITGSASNVTGVVAAANGGTGQSSYVTGDLLYASGATTLLRLADVAAGAALISGGVGVVPSWGKVGLTTHVTGLLPVANGGTGSATQNFVDLTSTQSVAGVKTFTSNVATAGAYTYTAPKTFYYNLNPAEFIPNSNAATSCAWLRTATQSHTDQMSACSVTALAPVHLPDGAAITEFMCRYYDNDASDITIGATLYRALNSNTSNYPMASISATTSGASGWQSSTVSSISWSSIDNQNNSYVVSLSWFGANTHLFGGCRIAYTMTEIRP